MRQRDKQAPKSAEETVRDRRARIAGLSRSPLSSPAFSIQRRRDQEKQVELRLAQAWRIRDFRGPDAQRPEQDLTAGETLGG
jgi:hypothetical protein